MRRDIFQAIADPVRRDILEIVANHPMTPNAIAEHFQISRQAVSKHIQILSECGLLNQQQRGREIYYFFDSFKMIEVDEWLHQFRKLWSKKFNSLDNILINKKSKKHDNKN